LAELTLDRNTIEGTVEYTCQHLGVRPHPEQWPILLSQARFNQVSGGIQSGKSYCTSLYGWAHYYLDRLKYGKTEPLLYWLVADKYDDTSQEFAYLCEFAAKDGFLQSNSARVDPGQIILIDGTTFKTKSAQDYRDLHKEAPNGIMVCEGGLVSWEAYKRVSERASPKRAWVFMNGTMEFSLGWWVEKIKQWSISNTDGGRSFILPSWTNTILYPGGREDPEIKRLENENSHEWFMERMGGEPCPPSGLVFKDFRMELHVGEYPFDPNLPSYPLIDPGYAGAYAVETVQKKDNRLYVVDEVFKQGLVTEEVIDICKGKPWWPSVSYGVVDIAAKQHQAQESVKETWQKAAGKYLTSQKVGINEGIERLKAFLKPDPIMGQPKILIDYRCQGLISEFGGCLNPETKQIAPYCWKTDRTGVVVGTTPEDKNNHAIKAVIYGLVDLFGYSLPTKQERRQRTNVYNW